MLEMKPKYDYLVKDYFGSMVITGLKLPENPVFNPLDKIWSSVKKRIYDQYGVSTIGMFVITPEAVSASFLLNCACCDDTAAAHKKYNNQFKETFPFQMMMFEEAITAFLTDVELGYAPYCDYIDSCGEGEISPKVCDKMLEQFLTSSGYKTEKDEKAKMKIRKAVARTVKH